jgi:nicotinate-nucleotide pyrophosphorylase
VTNHRLDLAAMVLLEENHIAAAGGVSAAIDLSLLLTPTAPAGGGHPAGFG